MARACEAPVFPEQEAEIYRVDYLPVVAAYCRKIHLMETINNLAPTRMEVEPGLIVQGMVIDIMSGRNPLYRLQSFFAEQDTQLLFGQTVAPTVFHDVNVGRTLDTLYEAGTMKLFMGLSVNAAEVFALETRYVHFDTTSVSVWGAYDVYAETPEEEDDRLYITHGHSKDKRPDLKQFLLKALCVERNIPLLGGTEDGNASDKTTNKNILRTINQDMAKHGLAPGAYVYIADSAFVTPENLKEIGKNYFISRLPMTYREAHRVIREAVDKNKWTEVGALAQTPPTESRPVASYRVAQGQVEIDGQDYRAVVVHSNAHDRRRQKRIDRELKTSRQQMEDALLETSRVAYACRPDAAAAGARLTETPSAYHCIETRVEERPVYARGRPAKNCPRKIARIEYRVCGDIRENAVAIARLRKEAGCFVLITNLPEAGDMAHAPGEVLKHYKDQHGVERNFSFLKDPLIVNDLFLKKPERIEALGMILLVALLIATLMERSLRKYVQQDKTTLPGWVKRRTTRPTFFMMTTKFTGIIIVKRNHHRFLAKPLTSVQRQYLAALQLPANVFTHPP